MGHCKNIFLIFSGYTLIYGSDQRQTPAQFQAILKKTETEKLALEKNPYPWDKFLQKSPERIKNERKVAQYKSYAKSIENFLGEKSSKTIERIMGKKIVTAVADLLGGVSIFEDFDSYKFPNTKEGKRAQFLKILYGENALTYKNTWLQKTQWDSLDQSTKSELTQANNGTMPNFGEFWLQRSNYSLEPIKNMLNSVKSFFNRWIFNFGGWS